MDKQLDSHTLATVMNKILPVFLIYS